MSSKDIHTHYLHDSNTVGVSGRHSRVDSANIPVLSSHYEYHWGAKNQHLQKAKGAFNLQKTKQNKNKEYIHLSFYSPQTVSPYESRMSFK